jgi:hypothetical protein
MEFMSLLPPRRIHCGVHGCRNKSGMAVVLIVLCLIIPRLASACAFGDAEYIPDPKDYRTQTNYFYYKVTVTPDMHMVLNLIQPVDKKIVTKLRMQYTFDPTADPAGVARLSKTQDMEVEFFTKDMRQMPVSSVTSEAPDTMILRDSHAKFLQLADDGLDIEYLTDARVKPGAMVDSHLELIPDVWVLDKCWSAQ